MVLHWCALSMPYFSVTFMVAMISLFSSGLIRVISSPMLMESASAWLALKVTGTGQKVPSASCILSHTPCQSALLMKPVSGVNAPIPIIMQSHVSMEVMASFFKPSAFFSSALRASPSRSRGFSFFSLPCGGTRAIIYSPFSIFFPARAPLTVYFMYGLPGLLSGLALL